MTHLISLTQSVQSPRILIQKMTAELTLLRHVGLHPRHGIQRVTEVSGQIMDSTRVRHQQR